MKNTELPKPILIEDLGMMFPTETSKHKARYGLFNCGFCGTEFKARIYDVNRGVTSSCGCLSKQVSTKHGLRYTRIHTIWRSMKNRTTNIKNLQYADYGGRGITICDEWLNITVFNSWAMENGYSKELTIDRIDNNKGYSPENCRWTTPTIQSRNQRIQKNNTSGYKGVSFIKKIQKYKAKITVNKRVILIGTFKTAVEGGIAYNNYIIENNLEGFILNEIPEKI